MSKLRQLRGRLAALRRARQTAHWGVGLSAVGIALLAALAGLFLLDWTFELNVLQRLLMFALALAALIWAGRKFAWPHFQAAESLESLALQVEGQHRIESDLIAALQFESPAAAGWGSTVLEERVVLRVSETTPRLDVFAGFSRAQLLRRAALFGVMALAAAAAVLLFPEYARVFGQRLLLGSPHYPTATQIEQIYLGDSLAYEQGDGGARPADVRRPQGQPLPFLVVARGVEPTEGHLKLRDDSGRERELVLEPLSLEQRRRRLQTALETIERRGSQPQAWRQRSAALLRIDSPTAAESLLAEGDPQQIAREVAQQIEAWPEQRNPAALYSGELPRLISSLQYQVFLGDAWTDRARVEMIGLPVVEVQYHITPPRYAAAGEEAQRTETGARRLSVLEGSRVELIARCVNGKQLEEVSLALHGPPAAAGETAAEPVRIALEPTDETATEWSYRPESGPLASVEREMQLSLTCRDADGLSLEAPLTCWIRLEADRSPTAAISVVHRVVLPQASPVVEYRVADDYGVASLRLLVDIERASQRSAADSGGSPDRSLAVDSSSISDDSEVVGESRATERQVVAIGPADASETITGPWPHSGRHGLDLSPFALVKGDQLKLTLEVTDYRGASDGATTLSDPLVIEVSDESGVLAAISEADQRSEQRLNELIKRQLGIGESP